MSHFVCETCHNLGYNYANGQALVVSDRTENTA